MSIINDVLATHKPVAPYGDCACGHIPDGPFVNHLEYMILEATGAKS